MALNRPRGSREDAPEQTTTKKKGKLNNMEMLGIGLFFFALCLYGISKCGKEDTPSTDAVVTEMIVDSTGSDSTQNTTAEPRNGSSFSNGNDSRPNNTRTNPRETVTPSKDAKLYVIIDSLKVRSGPSLDSVMVTYLRYGEEVIDMGERSVLEKIRISIDEVRTAPWVKIKTSKGKVGWAFGAGLQFYPVATQTNLQEGSN
jgi:uncharacterized protein YgiM (DUF1202 family)